MLTINFNDLPSRASFLFFFCFFFDVFLNVTSMYFLHEFQETSLTFSSVARLPYVALFIGVHALFRTTFYKGL